MVRRVAQRLDDTRSSRQIRRLTDPLDLSVPGQSAGSRPSHWPVVIGEAIRRCRRIGGPVTRRASRMGEYVFWIEPPRISGYQRIVQRDIPPLEAAIAVELRAHRLRWLRIAGCRLSNSAGASVARPDRFADLGQPAVLGGGQLAGERLVVEADRLVSKVRWSILPASIGQPAAAYTRNGMRAQPPPRGAPACRRARPGPAPPAP